MYTFVPIPQKMGVLPHQKGVFTMQGDASLSSITQIVPFLKYRGTNQTDGKVAR